MNKKHFSKFLLTCLAVVAALGASAQQKLTYEYVVRDGKPLKMDVYVPTVQDEHRPCMIFAFGGGFVSGSRNDTAQVNPVVRWAEKHGFVLVALDYRLGLKGAGNFTIASGIQKFRNAIDMAAEDLLACTDYILKNLLKTPQFTINPQYIVTLGSSAGAITALQADYMLGNRFGSAQALPDDFRYAGVMSFAGAIFSDKGNIKYRVQPPAPTLFCHGTDDHLVTYKQIQVFNLGLFGSNTLARRFEKFDYPYMIRRYKGVAHEAAAAYVRDTHAIDEFIDDYVFKGRKLQQDITIQDPDIPYFAWARYRVRDLKKMGQ
ncbi:MAG: carboxylesterase family protein [Bacteroidales bacterium]|nr:carboxylesterase family protein [Bacteroidales bacterium]